MNSRPKKRSDFMTVDPEVQRGIQRLLRTKVTRPKLTPVPDISDITSRDLSNHPLLTFNLGQVKKHKVNVFL